MPIVERGNDGTCWDCCGASLGLASYQEHRLILCDGGIAWITIFSFRRELGRL